MKTPCLTLGLSSLLLCMALLRLWTHDKTGAQVCFFHNDDTDRTFYIAFRTEPSDDTGELHILGHAVCAASAVSGYAYNVDFGVEGTPLATMLILISCVVWALYARKKGIKPVVLAESFPHEKQFSALL